MESNPFLCLGLSAVKSVELLPERAVVAVAAVVRHLQKHLKGRSKNLTLL
jgi:hypothetical protein